MQTAKQKLKRAAPWLFLLLVLAGLAAVRGLAANYEIGYEIMNGDFQNYNPVRHLLDNVPYKDGTNSASTIQYAINSKRCKFPSSFALFT